MSFSYLVNSQTVQENVAQSKSLKSFFSPTRDKSLLEMWQYYCDCWLVGVPEPANKYPEQLRCIMLRSKVTADLSQLFIDSLHRGSGKSHRFRFKSCPTHIVSNALPWARGIFYGSGLWEVEGFSWHVEFHLTRSAKSVMLPITECRCLFTIQWILQTLPCFTYFPHAECLVSRIAVAL